MKLLKGTIRPGTVREVLENGNIKATAPGLFSFEDDVKLLPPIMPWQIGSNCNSFSQPKIYDEVWIMNFADNPRQLYWFRKDNVVNDNINMSEENVEILCNREIGGEWATIYFTDGSGWVIGKGDSIINIKADGSILLTNGMPHSTIHINNGISLGSPDKSKSPAAKADDVEAALYEICTLLNNVATAALPNPYTTAIGTAILTGLPAVTSKIPNISSAHVTID